LNVICLVPWCNIKTGNTFLLPIAVNHHVFRFEVAESNLLLVDVIQGQRHRGAVKLGRLVRNTREQAAVDFLLLLRALLRVLAMLLKEEKDDKVEELKEKQLTKQAISNCVDTTRWRSCLNFLFYFEHKQ